MELFSEVFGLYYQITAEILNKQGLTREEIQNIIQQQGFNESLRQLLPQIMDEESLLQERNGKWYSQLEYLCRTPVTLLEKRWLKSILMDPRAALFLQDEELVRLAEELDSIQPLFDWESFRYGDQYLDGDDYEDECYRSIFRTVLGAVRQGSILHITYCSTKTWSGKAVSTGDYLPLRLEYSQKDDKFRVYCAMMKDGTPGSRVVLNMARIQAAEDTVRQYGGEVDLEACDKGDICEQPVVVKISSQRNGVERFHIEFSNYRKESVYSNETGECTVKIWYPKRDETEVLVRILGFGPVAEVVSPASFREQMRRRIEKQMRLINRAAKAKAVSTK